MTETLTAPRPEPICGMNTWMPVPARILDVRTENSNTKTFTCQFIDEEIGFLRIVDRDVGDPLFGFLIFQFAVIEKRQRIGCVCWNQCFSVPQLGVLLRLFLQPQ